MVNLSVVSVGSCIGKNVLVGNDVVMYYVKLKNGERIRLLESTSIGLLNHHFILVDDTHKLTDKKCFRVDQVVEIVASNVCLKIIGDD